ncbi:MAG: DUF6084 family protein [Candidatus Acidiferrales bacterium]
MPDLELQIESVKAVPYAAEPLLGFTLRVTNAPPEEEIHTVVLRAQIQINALRRRYTREEQQRLLDLFGEPDRWGQTLRSMLWTHANVVIPAFAARTTTELQVPCTFDFNVAATKYFHGVRDGELPLLFLFSGTVFYWNATGMLQVAPISWEKEAKFSLPVQTWRELMENYYPNSAWLTVRKDIFERLYQFKVQHAIPTWEQTLELLLAGVEETAER